VEGAAVSRLAGGRLPASYVNYLLVNGGIVMPSFGVPEDSAAAELLGRLYPHRRLVQVPSLLFCLLCLFFVFFGFF
jgi:agmatine/peptidylarginine deiminase